MIAAGSHDLGAETLPVTELPASLAARLGVSQANHRTFLCWPATSGTWSWNDVGRGVHEAHEWKWWVVYVYDICPEGALHRSVYVLLQFLLLS